MLGRVLVGLSLRHGLRPCPGPVWLSRYQSSNVLLLSTSRTGQLVSPTLLLASTLLPCTLLSWTDLMAEKGLECSPLPCTQNIPSVWHPNANTYLLNVSSQRLITLPNPCTLSWGQQNISLNSEQDLMKCQVLLQFIDN